MTFPFPYDDLPFTLCPFLAESFASFASAFILKIGLFGSITRKPLVRKCCKWSQKLLLGPLSTLDKSNWMGPFCPQIDPKRHVKLMEIRKTIYLPSTKKNLEVRSEISFF